MIVADAELKQIKEQAIREYPYECCGVIFTRQESEPRRLLLACRNQQNELHSRDKKKYPRDATTAYNIHAQDLGEIQRLLDQGFEIAVLYHSHIDVGAYFSETDKNSALLGGDEPLYPDAVYLVVSVRGKDSDAVHVDASAAFQWSAQKGDFAGVDFELA